jgi:hypothetical protein
MKQIKGRKRSTCWKQSPAHEAAAAKNPDRDSSHWQVYLFELLKSENHANLRKITACWGKI